MSENNFDTDMAVPSNIDAVNNYYCNNLTKIINKNSLSSSSETINSEDENHNIELTTKDKSNNVKKSTQNPQSITVSESSDVHFGNKIFNGPVTIKNIILRENDNLDQNNSINLAFEGNLKFIEILFIISHLICRYVKIL